MKPSVFPYNGRERKWKQDDVDRDGDSDNITIGTDETVLHGSTGKDFLVYETDDAGSISYTFMPI